jgi:hypothetical protein
MWSLSLVSITEELIEWKSSGSGSRKPRLTSVGIRCADHATPSIRQSWIYNHTVYNRLNNFYPYEQFDFHQYLQANVRTLTRIRLKPYTSNFLAINIGLYTYHSILYNQSY